jgi:hypothetical protein
VPIKQQRGHQFNNKKVRDNRENSAREKCRIWRKPIMLWWPYLWNPPLGHAEFLIYYSSHSPLLTDQRDFKEHNPFERNHHLKFPGKQKEIHLQGSFGRQPISLSSTVGACSFLVMWCSYMFPSLWTVEIENAFASKVLFMLNSSSPFSG